MKKTLRTKRSTKTGQSRQKGKNKKVYLLSFLNLVVIYRLEFVIGTHLKLFGCAINSVY